MSLVPLHITRVFVGWTTGRWAKPRIRNFSVMSAVSSMSAHKLFISTKYVYSSSMMLCIREECEMEDSGTTSGGYTYLLHDVSIECHHCHVSNAHERFKAFSKLSHGPDTVCIRPDTSGFHHTHTHTRSKYLLVITSLSISSWVPLGLSPRVYKKAGP